MAHRVVVRGTGNVGRPALRAVISHPQLELAGVVVADPRKVGRDAGELCGMPAVGVTATDDAAVARADDIDAVAYCASADTRPMAAFEDVLGCLRAGRNVVSTSLYGLLYPPTVPAAAAGPVDDACRKGGASVFVSGIDPGWAMDVLPLMLSGVVSDVREIRAREIFNYALYDAPDVVRNVIGFGGPVDATPPMLHDAALRSVWEPMVRIVAEGLGATVERVETVVEKRALEQDVDVAKMGHFEAGTLGAFRFEVRAIVDGVARVVVEHVTRIDDACAPDWPRPAQGSGEHGVIIDGMPRLHLSVHAEDPYEPGVAAGGNATAANRIVNAIPAVCAASPGVVSPLDLPTPRGRFAWAGSVAAAAT